MNSPKSGDEQRIAFTPRGSTIFELSHLLSFCDKIYAALLFSAYILNEKGKYLKQTVFFIHKICQAPNLYLPLRVLPIAFNSHKFSFVQFVCVGRIPDFF